MSRGFTLLELIVVIIIIGVLATLGFTQYTTVTEKGRTAEAKSVIGLIRKAQLAYKYENGTFAATLTSISVSAPGTCTSTHYFSYSEGAMNQGAWANRCTSGGKAPNAAASYSIYLDYDTGVWSGTAGYY